MPTQEDIQNQLELLSVHRHTLSHLLRQEALHGSEYTPPSVQHGIFEARDSIRRIKAVLRSWSVAIDDSPYDEVGAQVTPSDPLKDDKSTNTTSGRIIVSNRSINTGGGDYAEGSIDKRQGVFVSGGTISSSPIDLSKTRDEALLTILESLTTSVEEYIDHARLRNEEDLADDLQELLLSLRSARKAHKEGKAERRNSKLSESNDIVQRVVKSYNIPVDIRDKTNIMMSILKVGV